MKRNIPLITTFLCFIYLLSCAQQDQPNEGPQTQNITESQQLVVHPVRHATMALSWNDTTIYVDPIGGAEAFAAFDAPDLILVTDIHGDHFNPETINALNTEGTVIIVPQAVADRMPETITGELVILNNGESTEQAGVNIHAIPMYNLPQNEEAHHTKGRGNGYVLTMGEKRVYIAGDTEDIPEMRSLENIDIAFIPMNLPYTMTVDSAADAVLEFEPAVVYPYHFGDSDVEKFKSLVNEANPDIEVRLLDWYPDE